MNISQLPKTGQQGIKKYIFNLKTTVQYFHILLYCIVAIIDTIWSMYSKQSQHTQLTPNLSYQYIWGLDYVCQDDDEFRPSVIKDSNIVITKYLKSVKQQAMGSALEQSI